MLRAALPVAVRNYGRDLRLPPLRRAAGSRLWGSQGRRRLEEYLAAAQDEQRTTRPKRGLALPRDCAVPGFARRRHYAARRKHAAAGGAACGFIRLTRPPRV